MPKAQDIMPRRKFLKILKEDGYELYRRGKHEHWINPETGAKFSFSFGDIDWGTQARYRTHKRALERAVTK